MPETTPDHPRSAAMPVAPRQRLRYLRVLEAASLAARGGLDDVDLSHIAEAADVSLGTVYRYFPTSAHLMLALFRHQLVELQAARTASAGRLSGRAPAGLVTEIFHLRVMQPAVDECLANAVYEPGAEITELRRELDAMAHATVAETCGDGGAATVLLLAVSGLVQSVRNGRLTQQQADKDLKKACALLKPAEQTARDADRTA